MLLFIGTILLNILVLKLSYLSFYEVIFGGREGDAIYNNVYEGFGLWGHRPRRRLYN